MYASFIASCPAGSVAVVGFCLRCFEPTCHCTVRPQDFTTSMQQSKWFWQQINQRLCSFLLSLAFCTEAYQALAIRQSPLKDKKVNLPSEQVLSDALQ